MTLINIFVIFHNTLENTNMFFMNYNDASKAIKILANETNTSEDEWNIRVISEGEKFCADMACF